MTDLQLIPTVMESQDNSGSMDLAQMNIAPQMDNVPQMDNSPQVDNSLQVDNSPQVDNSRQVDIVPQMDNSSNLNNFPNEMLSSVLDYMTTSELVPFSQISTRWTELHAAACAKRKSLFIIDCTTAPALSSLYGQFGLHLLEQTNLEEVRYTLVYNPSSCSLDGDQLASRVRVLFPKLEHLALSIQNNGAMFSALNLLLQSDLAEKLVSLQVALYNSDSVDSRDFVLNHYLPWEQLFSHLNSGSFQTNLRTLTLVSLVPENESYHEVKSHLENVPYPVDCTFLHLSRLSSLERFCFGVEGAPELARVHAQIFLQLDALPKLQTFHLLVKLITSVQNRDELAECVLHLPLGLTELTLLVDDFSEDLLRSIAQRCTRLTYVNLNAERLTPLRVLTQLTKMRINRNTFCSMFPSWKSDQIDVPEVPEPRRRNEEIRLHRLARAFGGNPNPDPNRVTYPQLVNQVRDNPDDEQAIRQVEGMTQDLRQMLAQLQLGAAERQHERFDTITELILCKDCRMTSSHSREEIVRLVRAKFPNAYKVVQDNLKLVYHWFEKAIHNFTDLQLPEQMDVPPSEGRFTISAGEQFSAPDNFQYFMSCEMHVHSRLRSIQFDCEPFCTALELFTQLSGHCPNLVYVRLRCQPKWFDDQLDQSVQLSSVTTLHLDFILPKCVDYHQRYSVIPNRQLDVHLGIIFPKLVTLKLDGLHAVRQNYFHLNQSDLDWFERSLARSLPKLSTIWLLKSCDLPQIVQFDPFEVDVTPSVSARFRYQIVDLVNREVNMNDGTVQHKISLRIYQRTII